MTSIQAEFFDHRVEGLPFFEGWDSTLKAHFKSIPVIPDGGYTRGHFFEFADGKVSIRDTTTSDIFYEHNYIGSGTFGIVRESMIKSIFGTTPFESATLKDIILPQHRPKVWDTKKMSSFSGKFHTIPADFRSYYPHPPEVLLDGSVQEAIAGTKKRGRPQIMEGKKSSKKLSNAIISTGTNSILKYFGNQVEKALIQPSKSLQVEKPLFLKVSSLSISVSDRVSHTTPTTLPSTYVPDQMEITSLLLIQRLDSTPAVLPIPTIICIPPPVPISAIIEEDENTSNELYGFRWAKSSCSFDTISTILLYFYISLSRDQRDEFLTVIPIFRDNFENVMMSSVTSLAHAKEKLMHFFMGGVEPKFVTETHYAVEAVYDHIMRSITDQSDFMRIHYTITSHCDDTECIGYGSRIRGQNRHVSSFESCTLLDGNYDIDVHELIENYWARKVHTCQSCKKLLNVTRDFSSQNPIMITVSVNLMDTLIDSSINHKGSDYSLFAVAYTDEIHYIARIIIDNTVYEYDGMKYTGQLRLIKCQDPFARRIKTLSGSKYKAQMIFYKIDNIV